MKWCKFTLRHIDIESLFVPFLIVIGPGDAQPLVPVDFELESWCVSANRFH